MAGIIEHLGPPGPNRRVFLSKLSAIHQARREADLRKEEKHG